MRLTRRRFRALAAVILIAPSALLLAFTWATYDHYRIETPPRLGPEARAEVIRVARAVVDQQKPERPSHPELERPLAHRGPVAVQVWLDGRLAARSDGFGDTVADAVAEAVHVLPLHPGMAQFADDDAAARRARVKVDMVVGRGPLREGSFRAVSLNPGKEGVGVTLNGKRDVVLLPGDLIQFRMLHVKQPIEYIKDFKLGFDFQRAESMLAKYAKLPPGGYGAAKRDYFRFRTDSFVEQPPDQRDEPPLPLTRNLPPGPELTADNLREAALLGGRFLVNHLAPNGRYIYEVDLVTGKATDPFEVGGPYSLPRHAGTTYFLAELYRHTGEEWLREPIERAFSHMVELVEAGGCTGTLPNGEPFACVIDKGQTIASLGSTALGVVALVEYRRATGDPRYDELIQNMGNWILFMQRPDGSFRHLFDVPNKAPDEEAMLLYYSGESALAMARLYQVYEDPRYLAATEKALDWLVAWYDTFFGGGFFIGEEHWTCIASEAIWPHVKHDRYRVFCNQYGEFLRRQQPEPGDYVGQEDLVGSYGFSPFFVPNNTPVGSRSEAMISAYLLSKYHGKPNEEIRQQVLAAMRYALRQQIRPANAWNAPTETRPLGGVPHSGIDRTVRIDYVQHVCSAMVRSIELLE